MENLSLLLSENHSLPTFKIIVKDGCFIFVENNKRLGMNTIRNMIGFVNTLLVRYPGLRRPIVFEFQKVKFADKLTYILFECICDYLIEECGYKVRLIFSPEVKIHTAGIHSSPLLLLTTGRDEHIAKFKEKFRFDIYGKHYRRVVTRANLSKPDYLCKMMDDVAIFQKMYDVDDECREAISEVIIELVGNASEHGDANCLVDFDIAPSYRKQGSNNEFVGINIAIVNFSNQRLGSGIKEKIIYSGVHEERYGVVKTAYENHINFFGAGYREEDFFNMTAFQHKISGRHDSILTGGTGLTKLIESLESRSDAHMCYVTSGQRTLFFKRDYLTYSEDGWLGFNSDNDYIHAAPDLSIFAHNTYVLPGTAFNLNFVLEKEN